MPATATAAKPDETLCSAKQTRPLPKPTATGDLGKPDKDRLKDESGPVLEQVQALLEARPGLRLVVAGHTDAEGADAHNLDLSNRRAAAVVAWLVARAIAADRLQSEGHGEGRPVAGNDSAAGRALNRRVELREAAASADG